MSDRTFRIFIGITMPAPIGAIMAFLVSTMLPSVSLPVSSPLNGTGLNFFIFLVSIAYVFAGVQSILYAFLMEFYVNGKIKSDFAAISLSTVLGALFGLFIQLMTVGALTGLIMGIILRSLYLKKLWPKRLIWGLFVVFLLVIAAPYFFFNFKQDTFISSGENKTSKIGPTIGDLGGMQVSIPPNFAHFIQYQSSSQSKLSSFSFEVRFPDMTPLAESTHTEKRKSSNYNTMWLKVGVNVGTHLDELSVQRIFNGEVSRKQDAPHSVTPSESWKNKHGYKLSAASLYGLNVYEVTGYDDANRYKIPGNGPFDENLYFHVNNQGIVNTYIRCNNIKHDAARCEQMFMLPNIKNTRVDVSYRIGLLSQWREIQDSVSKVILGFADDPKNNDNKITNKLLTPSED